jgi:hypothetical protein
MNLKNISCYQCSIESDVAIRNHIEIYNRNSYPKIITNDTDLVVLMCDVECEIELTVRHVFQSHTYYEKREINPPRFFRKLFGCVLKADIIKILCVLLGTDFNIYSPRSVIHIRCFSEILKLLNIRRYCEITLPALKLYIYNTALKYPNDINVKETIAALNIYLNNVEENIYPLDEIDSTFSHD